VSQNVDARIRRTQTLIRDAFIALIVEQGFDNITVQAIAARAHINRATFYRHYTDIHDLVARLTNIMFVDVISQSEDTQFSQQTETDEAQWVVLFEHVAQYAEFYRAMIGKGGVPEFRERVRESVEQGMLNRLSGWGFDETNLKMPLSLPIRYLAAAQVGFMQWWLENGMPFPAQEAAQYLMALHRQGGIWALGLVVE
jgi:AcrR family transcriptional regulator